MQIKNFRFKKIKIYIKNLIFKVNKIIFENESEKKIKEVKKIIQDVNQSNIESKLKDINNIYEKFQSDPFLCKTIAGIEIDLAKNPEYGFNKIKNYNFLLEKWLNTNKLHNIKKEFIDDDRVTGSFGNYLTIFYYLMYRFNIQELGQNPTLLLRDNPKITNSALFKFFTPYLNIIQNDDLYLKLDLVKKISTIPLDIVLPFKDKFYPWFAPINFTKQLMKKVKNKKFDYFKIGSEDYEKGKKILKKMGLPDNAWYVTLHIRQGVGNELFNSNPHTYIKAVKEIIRRGGYVFRVGDKSMTPLPKIDGLIDFPFSHHKSEFFDIFLASTCYFCIGTSSGYWSVPTFFNKPVLLTNYLPVFDYYHLDEKNLFLPKTLIDKNSQKLISKEKLFKFPVGSLATNIQLSQNNISIIDNNEDEILQSTVEMFDVLDNKNISEDFMILNKKFKEELDELNKDKYEFPLKAMANFSSSFLNKIN